MDRLKGAGLLEGALCAAALVLGACATRPIPTTATLTFTMAKVCRTTTVSSADIYVDNVFRGNTLPGHSLRVDTLGVGVRSILYRYHYTDTTQIFDSAYSQRVALSEVRLSVVC